MTERTRRITVSPEYANALGYAVYCFCYLEWHAIWIIEWFHPKYIHQLPRKTAGQVADHLKSLGYPSEGPRRVDPQAPDLICDFVQGACCKHPKIHSLARSPSPEKTVNNARAIPGKAAKVDWTLADSSVTKLGLRQRA